MKRVYIFCLALSVTLGLLTLTQGAGHANSKAVAMTFTKNVAPILYKSCAECHRPTGVAPMSLLSYKEVRPWAKSLKERVVDRTMPPWFADPKHGEFSNNPSLSQAEIDTIVNWVDAGAPKGEDKDQPPTPKFTDGWEIGSPDLVLNMKEEHAVPADGTVPYL